MRKTLAILLLLTAFTALAAKKKTWPDTKIGALARGWVTAFSSGEPAMRKFLTENMAPEKLAERSVDKRIESYTKLRERLGVLKLVSIGDEGNGVLEAKLETSDGTILDFTFEAQTSAPHKLVAVKYADRSGGHRH